MIKGLITISPRLKTEMERSYSTVFMPGSTRAPIGRGCSGVMDIDFLRSQSHLALFDCSWDLFIYMWPFLYKNASSSCFLKNVVQIIISDVEHADWHNPF